MGASQAADFRELPGAVPLTAGEFEQIRRLVKRRYGLHLPESKQPLVRARLSGRLRRHRLTSFTEYLRLLARDRSGAEWSALVDALTTTLTRFFREPEHFAYLRDEWLPALVAERHDARRLRIWSAGCASGEEAYSIAIMLREGIGQIDRWDARLLATDLSAGALRRARQGCYPHDRLARLPRAWRARYFAPRAAGAPVRAPAPSHYQVRPQLQGMITFARLNLIGPWPMRGPFDAIFCRNVMIYFDRPTQQALVARFARLLAPSGRLFVGHAESLTGMQAGFRYVRPTVYARAA